MSREGSSAGGSGSDGNSRGDKFISYDSMFDNRDLLDQFYQEHDAHFASLIDEWVSAMSIEDMRDPLKQLNKALREWVEKNTADGNREEWERVNSMYQLCSRACDILDRGDAQEISEEEQRSAVALVAEIQELGDLPDEIVEALSHHNESDDDNVDSSGDACAIS